MKKAAFYLSLIIVSLVLLLSFEYIKYNDHRLHLIVCDVGQGDAIFITTPSNAQILIDGGPDKSVLSCLSAHMPFWDRSIDTIILTHPHVDHYAGLIDVLDRYQLNAFYTEEVGSTSDMHKLLEAKLAAKNLSAKYLTSGDNFKDKSGVEIKILWPSVDTIKTSDHNTSNLDLNGLSVVAILTFGNFSALLTGDAGENIMDKIAFEANDIDVLKVPHHGSRTGMTDSFLNSARPKYAVISVGKDNRYGHPAPESLKMLKDHDIKTLRTDQNGEVDVVSNGSSYLVKSKKN